MNMTRLIVLSLLLVAFSFPALAAEVIKSFDVQAVIHKNGKIAVTENITVNIEHYQINHGIYRDIPFYYGEGFLQHDYTPLKIRAIKFDGQKVDYHTQGRSNGIRIYIGNEKAFAPLGVHTYTIQYTVENIIGHFDEYDEFYWNVTGNDWLFPIDYARIKVVFPDGAKIVQEQGYTGPAGSTEGVYEHYVEGNAITANTRRPLSPNEGFTIAVAVQKGVLAPRTIFDDIYYFILANIMWISFTLSQIAVMAYLFVQWLHHGRDTSGIVIPRFDIMEGVTPDILRYLREMEYDQKTFTAMLVDAAARKYIRITENEEALVLEKLKELPHYNDRGNNFSALSVLFDGGNIVEIPLRQSSSSKDLGLVNRLLGTKSEQKALIKKKAKDLLAFNSKIKWNGFFIAAAGCAVGLWLSHTPEEKFLLGILSAVTYGLVAYFMDKPLNKYSVQGQKIMDYAEGLRMYLTVAEEARLNALYPKEITPEIFEKFLPYAYALGVEQEWTDYFNDMLRASGQYNEDTSYGYRSSSFSFRSAAGIGTALGAMNATIASAATLPSSSSGSGGGGSSGGGGGGGGGGGW